MATTKKILIIRLSSIGDIVLTTPIVRCIKQQIPNCQINYLVKEQYESVLSANPYIDNLLLFKNMEETKKVIKKNNYDFIVDLHNNFRSAQIKKVSKAKANSFPKVNIEKWLMVNFKVNRLPKKHIVDRYFEATKALNIKNDSLGLDFFIHSKNQYEFGDKPKDKRYLAIAVGAGHFTKQIPIENLQQIINNVNIPIVLLGDENDNKTALKLLSLENNVPLNLCGKLNIQQTASVIQNAKAVLCGDTGIMHIASAFHKKIFSIWGNTIPEFGMYPYLKNNSEKAAIYEVKGLKCRPCSKIGYSKCPKNHFNCMKSINYEKLIDDINNYEQAFFFNG